MIAARRSRSEGGGLDRSHRAVRSTWARDRPGARRRILRDYASQLQAELVAAEPSPAGAPHSRRPAQRGPPPPRRRLTRRAQATKPVPRRRKTPRADREPGHSAAGDAKAAPTIAMGAPRKGSSYPIPAQLLADLRRWKRPSATRSSRRGFLRDLRADVRDIKFCALEELILRQEAEAPSRRRLAKAFGPLPHGYRPTIPDHFLFTPRQNVRTVRS